MAFTNPLAQLFATAPSSTPKPQQNQDSILEGETYVFYGTRLCGKVTASHQALSAYLPKIYNQEKQRQYDNADLQEELSNKRRHEIESFKQKNAHENTNIEQLENGIDEDKRKIQEAREELESAKATNGEVNKMTKVKMVAGIIILSILTIYLFIFYSSTFFSAFFRTFDGDVNVGEAMFYANSIYDSYNQGIGQLLFIICAPIIFMGLGYTLHYFNVQETWTKYLKILLIISVTFAFDCILAYLIAEKIYNYWVLTQMGEFPPFGLDLAIRDINVWAVIFCGFIVYVIWGIVFDMTITAYGDLRSNEKEIKILNSRIESLNNAIAEKKNNIIDCKGRISANNHKIESLTQALASSKQFNPHIIRTALNDFFAGWLTMMSTLNRSSADQETAKQVYNDAINNLFTE
ncbi:MAG: hypothetical protein HDR90_08805 [Bacteroides sp.]|nr:hypothetical protein [Bacteroides sp.]